MIRVLIALLLLASPSWGQTKATSVFRNTWESFNKYCGPIAIRPIPTGTAPGSCSSTYTQNALGHVVAVLYGAENTVPVNATKDPLVTANGSSLVYYRQDTTIKPPTCSTPCFTYATDNITSSNTCQWPSAAAGVRGWQNGSTLALDHDNVSSAVSTYRPTGAAPIEMLSLRWDVIHWSIIQIDGFQNSWLATSGTTWASWISWIGGSSEWTWSERGYNANWDQHDIGIRYKDIIEARGGTATDYSYYLTRPAAGSAHPLPADGIMVRTDTDAYQDWYITNVVEPLMIESGVGMLYLANKIGQHVYPGYSGGHQNNGSNGSFQCADVYADYSTMLADTNSTGCLTGDTYSTGWTWVKYTEGQREIAQKLYTRGIKYAISTNGVEFLASHALNEGSDGASCTDNDTSTGNGCESDDWRWITAHASFIWFTDNCASCTTAFNTWIAGKTIPYVTTTTTSTLAGCLNAIP